MYGRGVLFSAFPQSRESATLPHSCALICVADNRGEWTTETRRPARGGPVSRRTGEYRMVWRPRYSPKIWFSATPNFRAFGDGCALSGGFFRTRGNSHVFFWKTGKSFRQGAAHAARPQRQGADHVSGASDDAQDDRGQGLWHDHRQDLRRASRMPVRPAAPAIGCVRATLAIAGKSGGQGAQARGRLPVAAASSWRGYLANSRAAKTPTR